MIANMHIQIQTFPQFGNPDIDPPLAESCPLSENQAGKPGLLVRGSRQPGASAANVVQESNAVELDVDLLDLPLARVLDCRQDGDSAYGSNLVAEVDGPDQGDKFAVEGFEVYGDGEVVGLFWCVRFSSWGILEAGREVRTATCWWSIKACLVGKMLAPMGRPARMLMLSE